MHISIIELLAKLQKVPVTEYPYVSPITPVVSVLVQTYQHAAYIEQCLDSVLSQQTSFHIEILVGEDNSTDGTRELCIEYSKKYPDIIRLFLHDRRNNIHINGNPTGRFNLLYNLSRAVGKYIAICEGDDYWTNSHKLQRQYEILEKNPKYGGCFHETQQINIDGKIGNVYGKDACVELCAEDTIATHSPFHTSSFMFKNKIDQVPAWFSKVVSADMALFSMVAKFGPLLKIAEIMSVYRKLESGITNSESVIDTYHEERINLINYLNKFHDYTYDEKAKRVIRFHKKSLTKQKKFNDYRDAIGGKVIKASGILTSQRDEVKLKSFGAKHSTNPENPFLNAPLTSNNMDLYYVRSSIKRALDRNLHNFRGTLLDIGCGEMPYREYLFNHCEITQYIGLDIDNPVYQKKIKPDLYWDGKSISLSDNSVDCAFATEVFEHLPDLETVLKEIYRVIKPGGRIFFTIPFLWPLHDVPFDEYRYTPFSLKRHFQNAGFDRIEIKALGGWNASLAQMIGLWINRSGLPKCDRQKYAEQFFPLYLTLLKSDKINFEFASQTMFTGLYGTATKRQNIKQQPSRSSAELPTKKNICPYRSVDNIKISQDECCLAIFTPCFGALSETFITNHIKYLSPGKTVVLTGKVEEGSWLNSPIKCIPFTDSPSSYKPEVEKEILDFFKQNRVTHILCEYGCAGTEIVILNAQLLHLPIFVHFHGYDVSQELRKPKTVRYYRWMGDNVTGIITDTRIQKKRLVEVGVAEDKIHIIPYGVEIQAMQAKPKASPCRFICVSRLVPKKGPIYLLKAFRKAREISPDITLDIVGDGPLMGEVQSFIAKDTLRSSVRIHGAKSNDFVKNLLCKSSVYVQHSVTDPVSGDAEGLPVSILEAAAAGLPVVSTLHEGIPDEVEHGVTGFLVKEFDVDTMAMHMAHLAGNNELRSSMGIAARKKIQKSFTLEHEINSLRILMDLSDARTDSREANKAK